VLFQDWKLYKYTRKNAALAITVSVGLRQGP